MDRPALGGERPHIQRAFPHTRSLISFVLRMNRDNVRSPARSVANLYFHHTGDEVNDVARDITAALERAREPRRLNGLPHLSAPLPGISASNCASKSASRNASNAGLDEFFPTRW